MVCYKGIWYGSLFNAALDAEAPAGEALAGVASIPLGTAGSVESGGTAPQQASGLGSNVWELSMVEIGTTGEAGGAATQGAGVFMGEGLPPIPAHLAERI